MNISNKCEYAGWISPDGDYYGISDEDILYIHIAIASQLAASGKIPNTNNNCWWLEQHRWIKQHGNVIITRDTFDKEWPITDLQIKTICKIMGQKYKFIDFAYQNKYASIDELKNMDKWQLHYKITS